MGKLVVKYDHKSIGDRIRTIRQSLGKTTDEFGKYFNPPASKGTISKWENGKYLPNNERLVKIAELGETSVEYLLKGKEVRDLEGNLMPVSLRLHDHTFIKHYKHTLKGSTGIILNTIVELTDEKTYYYSGFRSIIELKQPDFQNKLPVKVYIDSFNKRKFSNVVVDLESNTTFRSEDYHISNRSGNFISLSTYLSQKNIINSDTYHDFSNDQINILKKIINEVTDLPSGMLFDFHFVYFDDYTSKVNTAIIQMNN